MQKINGIIVKTGVIALALALAGCGGGGSSTGDTPAAVTPVAQRDVQGTAAKGLIKGAKISIYAIDAQGVRATAALATAVTGTDGSYKLQVPASFLNFVIEVSAAPGAVMADEATGEDIALPESMKLRNVVTLAENATGPYVGTVSPLTEMVARTAETADGKLPRAAVAQAKVNVRTLLGFDPENVKPVNSNSPAAENATGEEKTQSLALAAISKMGNDVTADCGQSTPGERISCVVTKLAASVTTKDGEPALEPTRLAQFSDAIKAVAKDQKINRTGNTTVPAIPALTPAPSTPGQPPAAALTPLQATKALFGSLRTNINAVAESDALRATADGIKADLDGTVAPLANQASGFAALAVNILDRLDRYRANPGPGTVEKFDVWRNQIEYGYTQQSYPSFANGDGTCQITKSPLSMTCTVYLDHLSYAADWNSVTYATRVLKVEPKPGSTTEFTYSTYFQKRAYSWNGATPPAPQQITPLFSGDMSFARSGPTITQLAVKGRMPGRLDNGVFQSDYEDWSLSIARTQEAGDVGLYKFGGKVTAILAGAPAGSVEIDDSSFLRLALAESSTSSTAHPANELYVTLRGTMGNTGVNGTLRASDDKFDKSKTAHMPTTLSFEGSLKHKDATVFSGKVDITRTGYENFDASAAESETNFVKDSVKIGGTLSVPNRPALSLTLGASRTGLNGADISAQYRDGTSTINASSSVKRGERHPLVKIASAEGVNFSFTDTTKPAQVFKDGEVVASIDLTKGIVTYADGSTESLK